MARASAPRPPSKPRGGWQLLHPCPTPSQRQRILAMSKYPGSKWVDLPSTCNTTRDKCRRDPRLASPSQQQVELRHSTSPQVRPCAACMERNRVTSSASQPAQNCMCIFPKVSLNGLVSKKKVFFPNIKQEKYTRSKNIGGVGLHRKPGLARGGGGGAGDSLRVPSPAPTLFSPGHDSLASGHGWGPSANSKCSCEASRVGEGGAGRTARPTQVQGAPFGLAHPTNPCRRLQWVVGWDAQNRLENKAEMMNRAY